MSLDFCTYEVHFIKEKETRTDNFSGKSLTSVLVIENRVPINIVAYLRLELWKEYDKYAQIPVEMQDSYLE